MSDEYYEINDDSLDMTKAIIEVLEQTEWLILFLLCFFSDDATHYVLAEAIN